MTQKNNYKLTEAIIKKQYGEHIGDLILENHAKIKCDIHKAYGEKLFKNELQQLIGTGHIYEAYHTEHSCAHPVCRGMAGWIWDWFFEFDAMNDYFNKRNIEYTPLIYFNEKFLYVPLKKDLN